MNLSVAAQKKKKGKSHWIQLKYNERLKLSLCIPLCEKKKRKAKREKNLCKILGKFKKKPLQCLLVRFYVILQRASEPTLETNEIFFLKDQEVCTETCQELPIQKSKSHLQSLFIHHALDPYRSLFGVQLAHPCEREQSNITRGEIYFIIKPTSSV